MERQRRDKISPRIKFAETAGVPKKEFEYEIFHTLPSSLQYLMCELENMTYQKSANALKAIK